MFYSYRLRMGANDGNEKKDAEYMISFEQIKQWAKAGEFAAVNDAIAPMDEQLACRQLRRVCCHGRARF